MGLRELAEADLAVIIEDENFGFGREITLTNPDGDSETLIGFTNDVSQVTDPETGQLVSIRLASATLRISTITISGGLPEGVADASAKPWRVSFEDILGNMIEYKVAQGNPDRALGVIFLVLELYKAP